MKPNSLCIATAATLIVSGSISHAQSGFSIGDKEGTVPLVGSTGTTGLLQLTAKEPSVTIALQSQQGLSLDQEARYIRGLPLRRIPRYGGGLTFKSGKSGGSLFNSRSVTPGFKGTISLGWAHLLTRFQREKAPSEPEPLAEVLNYWNTRTARAKIEEDGANVRFSAAKQELFAALKAGNETQIAKATRAWRAAQRDLKLAKNTKKESDQGLEGYRAAKTTFDTKRGALEQALKGNDEVAQLAAYEAFKNANISLEEQLDGVAMYSIQKRETEDALGLAKAKVALSKITLDEAVQSGDKSEFEAASKAHAVQLQAQKTASRTDNTVVARKATGPGRMTFDSLGVSVGYARDKYDVTTPTKDVLGTITGYGTIAGQDVKGLNAALNYYAEFNTRLPVRFGLSLGTEKTSNLGNLKEVTEETIFADPILGTSRLISKSRKAFVGPLRTYTAKTVNSDLIFQPNLLNQRLSIDVFGRYEIGDGESDFTPGLGFFLNKPGAPLIPVAGIILRRPKVSGDRELSVDLVANYGF